MNWLMYQTRWRTGKIMSPVCECCRVSPLTSSVSSSPWGIGDLVGGDEPRTERIEALTVLALVPLAATLELEGALGDVVADRVPRDVGQRVIVTVEISSRTADHHSKLDLVVGLGARWRDGDGIVRAVQRVRRLHEQDRLVGDRLAGLCGVPSIVQADTHDLSGVGDGRTDAKALRIEPAEVDVDVHC